MDSLLRGSLSDHSPLYEWGTGTESSRQEAAHVPTSVYIVHVTTPIVCQYLDIIYNEVMSVNNC